MDLLWRIAQVIIPVFLIVAVGWAYGRRTRPDLTTFNRIVLDVLSPLLVYTALADRAFHWREHVPLLVGGALLIFGTGLVAWLLARATHTQPRTLVPVVMFTNCGNMGLPLALLAFGQAQLGAAVALFSVSCVRRTPRANSISGTIASPSSFMPLKIVSGGRTPLTALAKPSALESIRGLSSSSRVRACALVMREPTEKWIRLLMENSATAAPKPGGPNASSASGRPMLPQLLNIIGGTNVRTFSRMRRASGHARSPEPSTMPMLATISGASARTSNDCEDNAEKISAGASTFMLSRLTMAMSGRTWRPHR